jgi:SH3-like domain-containing protein
MAKGGKGFGWFLLAAGLLAVWLQESSNPNNGIDRIGDHTTTNHMSSQQLVPPKVQTLAALRTKKQNIQQPQPRSRRLSTRRAYVNASALNVRQQPSLSGAVLGRVNRGTPITILATKGEWLQVSFSQGTGWVHADYVVAKARSAAPRKRSLQPQPTRAMGSTNAQIVQAIIAGSLASYRGRCPCPYNIMSNGRRCGGRSAYSRPGGHSPICYPQDVTASMIAAYRARQ